MIYNGFRRIALAHSLLPLVIDSTLPPTETKPDLTHDDDDRSPLDDVTQAQDHQIIRM